MTILDALRKHEDRLMAIPGVTGVGITGTGEDPAILVMIRPAVPGVAAALPAELEGFPVRVEPAGEITAFDDPD